MKKIDIACIVDDDPVFVFATKKVMEMADFCNAFMVFHNGKQALDNLTAIIKSEGNLPDIILLDLNMPVMDGWQFLDEFIKVPSPKEITIFIVSSSIDPEDVNKAKSYDAVNNYVVKPITRDVLADILRSLNK